MGTVDPGVDPGLHTRKHVQVREYVRDVAARLEPGDAIPSERYLAEALGVARMTVRQAVDVLVGERVLERSHGRGTFVRDRGASPRLLSFTEEADRRGKEPTSRPLVLRREQAGPALARALGVTEGDALIHLRRLRSLNDEPVAVQDSYLVEVLLPGLVARGVPASLWKELEARRLRPTTAETTARAVTVSGPDAGLLELDDDGVGLQVSQRLETRGRPIEVSRTVYLADRWILRIQHGQDV